MAEDAGVSYAPTVLDTFAQDVTRLAGDDVDLDEIELTILALHRAGRIDGGEMMKLQDAYLSDGMPTLNGEAS